MIRTQTTSHAMAGDLLLWQANSLSYPYSSSLDPHQNTASLLVKVHF